MKAARSTLVGVLLLGLSGCFSSIPGPTKVDSTGFLDLRAWEFGTQGPVVPQGWLWDAGVLWSPESGGRPGTLPPAAPLGPPDRGGSFSSFFAQNGVGTLATATAHLTVLVKPHTNYGLQVGVIPGAFQVWCNGVLVWQSGVVSSDPTRFLAQGTGTVLSLQPRDGQLDLVIEIATADPLILHSEMNRLWILGPADTLVIQDHFERSGRFFQAAFLLLAVLIFGVLGFFRPERKALLPLVAFLFSCLVKILFNVEEAEPMLAPFWPGLPPALSLALNHGFNLLPFPLMVLFLQRQFPEDISVRSVWVVAGATVVATLWELLPLLLLVLGAVDAYLGIMRMPWSFLLNLYVVLVVLFIFERFYHLRMQKRPLSAALFWGGIAVGLLVLLPIPLSYFFPVKFTLFMGWGLFFFLLLLGFSVIRLQISTTEQERKRLTDLLSKKEVLSRFVDQGWAPRLGREAVEDLRPGDQRSSEVVFLQVSSPDPVELWYSVVGAVAEPRQALLAGVGPQSIVWVMDSWPETALAFALEAQIRLQALRGLRYRIVLCPGSAEFTVLESGSSWLPLVKRIPWSRLASLDARAQQYGALLVLDQGLKEGLVIGGWRRHRHLGAEGTEYELYEGEEESLAQIKDHTLDAYEAALAAAGEGHFDRAVQGMVAVIRENPFDQPARALLAEWGNRRP